MDFLDSKTLSIIKEAIANIRKLARHRMSTSTQVPIDDPKTYQLYCEGRTTGTFQFESAGMQKYLARAAAVGIRGPHSHERPLSTGPMDYIP